MNDGIAAGRMTLRNAVNRRGARGSRPARSSTGEMLSMPLIRPLAIDGAAPSTTTKMIALSLRPKSRIAAGNHATDGMVCSPVIIDPIAARSTGCARRARRSWCR